MLKMFASCRLNICAVWNGLIFARGDNMNTRTPCLPRIAYSAAEPVSPDVAPRMLSSRPSRCNTYSNRLPSNCIAMSLNASVGPFERPRMCRPGSSVVSGVMSVLPNTSALYVLSTKAFRASAGMSSMNFDSTAKAKSGYDIARMRVSSTSVNCG